MGNKKRSIQETAPTVIVEDAVPREEDQDLTNLSKNLGEIRNAKGVVGYIMRNTTAATIDLKEQKKIIEYAILSSQALDFSLEISNLFDLGNVESVLIEGKEIKALCIIKGENKISIFMEKNADHAGILKRVSS